METINLAHSRNRTRSASQVRLLSLKAAAAYLSLSYWTLRELVWCGELPSVRAGRRILVDRNDLDTWIGEHKE